MGNRSMLEINHDTAPFGDKECAEWARKMFDYFSTGNPKDLPRGVTWFGMRHHSTKCPLGEPPRGWNN